MNGVIHGGRGNYKLKGDAGAHRLYGQGGRDTLTGGGGKDKLIGGGGKDTLDGGAGKDLLNGGKGADQFIFSTGNQVDKIKGFADNVDTLVIDHMLHGGIATASDALAVAHDTGSNIVFNFGSGDTLILNGAGGSGTGFLLDDINIA